MEALVLAIYFISIFVLSIFGSHGFVLVYYYFKNKKDEIEGRKKKLKPKTLEELFGSEENYPNVTIQLPIYNELYVAPRLLDAVSRIDYPKEKMQIQVLDDSTDETVQVVALKVMELKAKGFDIEHIRRGTREGFKAGALKYGMKFAKGDFIAIFDADFVPKPDFLKKTLPYFYLDGNIGMVQTRWEHLNENYSLLTQAQALALNGHFIMEQYVKNESGFFITFNGTGGIWRRSCIEDAGNWQGDTLAEDMDLSYRAQLKKWKFVFLKDVVSPAELPSEINALKSQQFRWTKGAIEVGLKYLGEIWRENLPLKVKLEATFHLTNNLVFPFILLTALLNPLVVMIKERGDYDWYYFVMGVFVLPFFGPFLVYTLAQREIYSNWKDKIILFPLFLAGSMGLAVNNTRAVILALLREKTEFVRTPKYGLIGTEEKWETKRYVASRVEWVTYVEILLAIYMLIGMMISVYYLELAALPFQMMFFAGFSFIGVLSVRHSRIWNEYVGKVKLALNIIKNKFAYRTLNLK
ncbi:Glycosyltransferase, catalytic subunit of cellulose synthase and poly-beta-1,6-N-acetylglucosamine synthase [Candidatus Kryptonium thompsonii]|uniref:Glycosyltransferase, catalytic subunit of cellulose synthase and poly-beta-1,6-N-acetylglucosamine synthase n=1 Tax=Candidatus Kryptonium thompsonii TaxID=1633631 RepID=A0A0P1MB08_9BACT|nr:cellulose synthase family protein [Candidatus Kryptonium thompsoni]CUS82773.1 Glycosyltransferase, catalytic subunit of cellulose synthase and poly-beta-1,6-N-acetylglucosamine synthase [Candidatus Kryptonium thompsoni]CUS84326.1 Glycosyltransferase, catalytic subunit of cellulose synthase and poly-beta-1,6-N-acetylglucosamine synthase [Candidatus Kryptonium thompsoni]CUS85488.1 Glycosyltransferase, catalytic subunit of cellulose synthase and poly-beta-1,6-N-acetylglucosamine synthase [Candid